jgi:hypothetical protein
MNSLYIYILTHGTPGRQIIRRHDLIRQGSRGSSLHNAGCDTDDDAGCHEGYGASLGEAGRRVEAARRTARHSLDSCSFSRSPGRTDNGCYGTISRPEASVTANAAEPAEAGIHPESGQSHGR